MEKFAEVGMLLGIYGGLLTDRQRDVMDLYYNYDLSLSEIAEQLGISRQGVHDLIKRSEQILSNADQSIGALGLKQRIMSGLEEIREDIDGIIQGIKAQGDKNPDELIEELNRIKEKASKMTTELWGG